MLGAVGANSIDLEAFVASCLLCDRPIRDAQRRTVRHESSDFAVCALCAVLREVQQATCQADLTVDEEAVATCSLSEALGYLQSKISAHALEAVAASADGAGGAPPQSQSAEAPSSSRPARSRSRSCGARRSSTRGRRGRGRGRRTAQAVRSGSTSSSAGTASGGL